VVRLHHPKPVRGSALPQKVLMKIIVFDIEIAKAVESVKGGWNAAREGACGVSCVCLWDSETGRPHVYDDHTIEECMNHLASADLLVSFNGKGFDVPALEGYTKMALAHIPHYDILAEIWKAAQKKIKGYRLAEVGSRTIGREKSGTGEHAPELFAQGRWGELVDYCLNDVYMTKDLFEFIVENGYVLSPDLEEFYIDKPILEEDS